MLDTLIQALKKNLRSYILIIALVAIWLAFGMAAPGYWTADHIQSVVTQMAIIAIMACGMVFVIVTGGIDLSVGFGAGFVSVVGAALLYYGTIEEPLVKMFPDMSEGAVAITVTIVVIILSIILGILIGLFQGSLIAYLKVPPFIVTLGGMYIFKSGILIVTQGKTLFFSNESFKFIAQGFIPPIAGLILAALVTLILFVYVLASRKRKIKHGIDVGSLTIDIIKTSFSALLIFGYVLIVNRTFDEEAIPEISGVPFLVIILAIIFTLMSYISTNTRFGRYTYAIGGNREAARLSGINIDKTILMVYVAMGILVAVSGIALAAYVGSGTTSAGQGYELDVIASCILGGTSTLGGEGSVFGAIVGALIMQSLSNGLQMMNVSSNFQYLIKGLVLILAVLADISMKKKHA
ncbi:MAG: sugar ABC transporter permease [Deltaproteobacteria bacterium]|nr:sugar ABC transporter permease [Deltaproteobacteria bacterium]